MTSDEKFLLVSYPKFVRMVLKLCLKVFVDRNHEKFDYIISVQRGGAVMSKIVSDLLDIPIGTLTVRSYWGMNRIKTTRVTQPLSCEIAGKKVIVLDEISDTGKTLTYVKKYLKKFRPVEVVFATLFVKPWTDFIPDFYVEKTPKWIIFPYELQEMLGLVNKMGKTKYDKYLAANGASTRIIKEIVSLASNK
jgi:hypoxanthine phosphoribosyltransferase